MYIQWHLCTTQMVVIMGASRCGGDACWWLQQVTMDQYGSWFVMVCYHKLMNEILPLRHLHLTCCLHALVPGRNLGILHAWPETRALSKWDVKLVQTYTNLHTISIATGSLRFSCELVLCLETYSCDLYTLAPSNFVWLVADVLLSPTRGCVET